jgi:carbamoyltransferase
VAPIVKSEACSKYIDVKQCSLTDFMLLNAKVLDDRLVGVTHVDGTARVQTVSKEFNPTVWKLLDLMEEETGIPVLINTSLNIAGEPICETYAESLNAFKRTQPGLLWQDGTIYKPTSAIFK